MIRLVQEFGAQAGRQLPFERDRIRVGRAADNDVVFDANIDLDSSGRHCEIVLVDGGWTVIDAGSRNGTFVNGVRVQRQGLKHNDVIECGRGGPRLRVEILAGTVSVPPPAPFSGGTFPSASPMPSPASATPASISVAPVAPPIASASQSNPFASSIPAVSSPAFGSGSGTVAMPQMELPGGAAHAAGSGRIAASGAPSVGQAITSGLPDNAQVGKRTVALMIDQALVAQAKRNGAPRRLYAMVALLTLLVVGGLAAGVWFALDQDDRPRGGSQDSSSVGARIAAANENNIYLLAMRGADQHVRGFCTGFAVNENVIATNAHCVRVATTEIAQGAQLFVLRNKNPGAMLGARPVYLDARFQNAQMSRGGAGYDLGLVQTEGALPGWVRLAPDEELFALREGDALFVYGFPGMTMNERSPVATITLGLLNRLTDFYDGVATAQTAQKLQHSAQTSGGSSGSPIFGLSGAVIGVNAGSLSDEERQVVTDPTNGQRREVEVNRGSNFKYGMRADLIRQAMASVNTRIP